MTTIAEAISVGWQCYQSGDYGRAAQILYQVLEVDPNQVEAYHLLGAAYQALGRLEDAVTNYRHALTLEPDRAEVHNNIGIALAHMARWPDALRHFESAVQFQPDYADAHCNL